MQTNREYFNSLTVPVLKSILSDFRATGISKMRKGELINFLLPLMDGAHIDAIAKDNTRKPVEVVTKPRTVKSYTERMLNRVQGYYTQNGSTRLKPAQERRINKKYRKQYGNLLKSLTA
jgi:hypothetical protein